LSFLSLFPRRWEEFSRFHFLETWGGTFGGELAGEDKGRNRPGEKEGSTKEPLFRLFS
jgi:hypothetical protein